MRQFAENDLVLRVGGPEYQEEMKLIIKDIDPYAMLNIERISRDMDFQRQRSNEEMMLTQLAMQLKIPPQKLLERLGNATDTGATGEFFGALNQEMAEDEQAKQQMQDSYEAEMQQQSGGAQ